MRPFASEAGEIQGMGRGQQARGRAPSSPHGRQCAISTGRVMERSTTREVPPSNHSLARLWP